MLIYKIFQFVLIVSHGFSPWYTADLAIYVPWLKLRREFEGLRGRSIVEIKKYNFQFLKEK